MGTMTRIAAATVLLTVSGGCATLREEETDQLLEIHAVQNSREVAGVGCVLSNDLGRWFVMAPGRVRVKRSTGNLKVECGRDGLGNTAELFKPRYSPGAMIGNVITTAGLGYAVDRYSGAGFYYPEVLTMMMPRPPQRDNLVADAPLTLVF